MTTIKIFALAIAFLMVLFVSYITEIDLRDIMTIVSFVGTINLLTSRWVSIVYLRAVMKDKDKQ